MIKELFIADLKTIRSWWSVRVSAIGIILMAGVPALSDQFPNIAPSLLSFFPKHGQQWVPIAGALLAVLARIVSQAAIIDQLRGMFKRKGGNDGTH
jgi:hypothetical protein